MLQYKTKLLIIGSGPAGYTAAIYAVRSGLEPILISGEQLGGQLIFTNEIENFPGFPTVMRGSELMSNMHSQALNLGTKIIDDTIIDIDFANRPFVCKGKLGNVFTADALIIATGSAPKLMGLKNEEKYLGFGVSVCATCDGFFYRNKDVAIVGGGASAVAEALDLSRFAKSVTVINKNEEFTADAYSLEKFNKNEKIKIKINSMVEDVLGTDEPRNVTGIKIKNKKTGMEETIDVSGIFMAIGYLPRTYLFKNHLNLDENGYIITKNNSCQTNIEGIFAAGDIRKTKYRQAILAASSGALASLEAFDFLKKKK